MVDFTKLEHFLAIDDTKCSESSVEALNDYIRKYMLSVPFENINVQNGWPLALTDEAMMRKVVEEQRGGFCYEMNYFFKHYLEYKGFDVAAMSATVMSPTGWAKEGSHMFLKVTIDGKDYVVDIGFGDMPKFALPIAHCDEGFSDVTGDYRVKIINDKYYDIEKWSNTQQAWQVSYRVLNEPKTLEDCIDGIAFNQYSPDSIFVQGLLITKATETGRNTMTQNHVTLLADGEKTIQETTKMNYQTLLETYFGIPKMTIDTFV